MDLRPRLHNPSHECIIPFATAIEGTHVPFRSGDGALVACSEARSTCISPLWATSCHTPRAATDGSWYRRQATDETAAKRADHWRILSGYRVFRMERVPCPAKTPKTIIDKLAKHVIAAAKRSGYRRAHGEAWRGARRRISGGVRRPDRKRAAAVRCRDQGGGLEAGIAGGRSA